MSDAATLEAPDTTAAPAPAPAAAAPAPAPTPAPAPSLLQRGAAPAAPAAAPAPAAEPPAPKVPDKYLVKNEDGTINHEATALKVAEGYAHLERRLGSGDAPPKTPDDYAPTVPEGLTIEALKADPLYTGFLKGAHSRGMTNAQVSYVLDAMAQRMRPDPAAAEAELRKDYPDDATLGAALASAYKATAAYAGDQTVMQRLEAKFGSDPDFIRLMAKVGRELREDSPPQGLTNAEADSLESLMASPAYLDTRHADHARVVRQVQALYAKKYPET